MRISLENVSSSKELHALLKREFDFPYLYGNNWSAFGDAITGLVEMPKEIEFTGWSEFCDNMPKKAEHLRRIMTRYVDMYAKDYTINYK